MSVLSLRHREDFYSANETLQQIADELSMGEEENSAADERDFEPDPGHERGSSSSTVGSSSQGVDSFGNPIDSDREVVPGPEIAVPANTISAKITLEVPTPRGTGSKVIEYPLSLDLAHPIGSKPGKPPIYEVNIPVTMGRQEPQEMTRDIELPVSTPATTFRKDSSESMCSFSAWGGCCKPSPAPPPKNFSSEAKLGNSNGYPSLFNWWPSSPKVESLDGWGQDDSMSKGSKASKGIPSIPEIKTLDISACVDRKLSPSCVSARSDLSWMDLTDAFDRHMGESGKKTPVSKLDIRALSHEKHIFGGKGRSAGTWTPKSKTTLPEELDSRAPSWPKAKSLESPGRTGGYGETAVDVLPQSQTELKNMEAKEAAIAQPKVDSPQAVKRKQSTTSSLYSGVSYVGRKISSGIHNIARKFTESLATDIPVPDGDDPFTPGIGWVPRKDEVGDEVKTVEELKKMNGTWELDPELSDSREPAMDIVQLPWLVKRAVMYATQTEIKVYDDRVYVIPKFFGLSAPQESFFGREGRLQGRRDRRKGLSRIALVPTKTGLRQ
ncbi:hypothetical protein BSKO_08919 [Bryopsis sp. KO-2023]|nr:hypothetical protein BSKO_08919 [Bryopsis sp. KO-2023]